MRPQQSPRLGGFGSRVACLESSRHIFSYLSATFFYTWDCISVTDVAFQRCISPDCGATYSCDEVRVACDHCGSLLDVVYDWDRIPVPTRLSDFEAQWTQRHSPLSFSGVWRYHALLPFAPVDKVVTVGEGQTLLQRADGVAKYVNLSAGNLSAV